MTTVAFRELTPALAQRAPTAPMPLLVRALREAAREFCERSEAYRHVPAPLTLVGGLQQYELDLPADTVVVRVIDAVSGGRPLQPTSEALLARDMPDWRTRRADRPSHYMLQLNGTMDIVPRPTTTQVLAVDLVLALKPSRSATGLEEWLVERFEHTLLDGALNNLLGVRGTEWYQPDLAGAHGTQFLEGIETARSAANKDNTPKVRVTSYGGY